MATFMQAIEFTTLRIAEVETLVGDRRDQVGGSAIHGTITACRERPDTYLTIVESPSAEAATENCRHPLKSEFVARLAELCEGTPKFYNLDSRTRQARLPHQRST